jgi:hypothetical protein
MKKLTIILALITVSVLGACTGKQRDYKNIYTPYTVSGIERVVIYDHCVKCMHGVYLPYQGKNVCTFCNSEKLASK